MELFFYLQNIVGAESIFKWLATSILFSFVFSYTDIYFFINLFKIEVENSKKLLVFLIDSLLRILCVIFIPMPYYRLFEIIITITLFKIFFHQSIEKCILGHVLNSIATICIEVIVAKSFCNILKISSYRVGIYDYRYKTCIMLFITLFKTILCCYAEELGKYLDVLNNVNKNNKNTIVYFSLLSSLLIFLNVVKMTVYTSDIPYSIFVIDIFSLIVYFYISLKNIIKISKLEEQDIKIHNLEEYNKILSTMYDGVRVLKHNFSNYVQALDGYAMTNDVEGIRMMCKSLCKECRDVNDIRILDPNIINNPAVYSIITNKYNLAQKVNIKMNIEVSFSLKEIEMDTYELCKILGILLDNAIEAASECAQKIVNIKFIKNIKNNTKSIIIENTYSNLNVDLDKIFEKGYSSKDNSNDDHGLGLWNVRRILSHYDSVNLLTVKGKMFSQKLEFNELCIKKSH